MNPLINLPEPNPGNKIKASDIRNLSKAVKALQPSVGFGIRISRNNNGTIYSLDKNIIDNKVMYQPFDVIMKQLSGSTLTLTFKAGKLFYVLNNSVLQIPNEDDGDEIEVIVPGIDNRDDVWIGIKIKFGTEGEEDIPESFSLGVLQKPDESTSEPWVDFDGTKCYPLVNIVMRKDGVPYSGPYVAMFSIAGIDEGTGTESDERHYIIQSHHGNVWIVNGSEGEAFVADLTTNGSMGGFRASIVDGLGNSSGEITVHVTELALTASLPTGARCIAHKIPVKSAAAGDNPTSGD